MIIDTNILTLDSVFFVLDFDRTLADTDKLHEALDQAIEQETTIKASQLRAIQAEIESTGQSFDAVHYLHRLLADSHSEKTWLQIRQAFIVRAQKQDMLEPYAAELLHILHSKNLPYGIVTFGGEAWQLAKIEAAGLNDVPRLVTQIEKKGNILTGWKHGKKTFIIPPSLTHDFRPLEISTVVFLDDKARSFSNVPSGVLGVQVCPPETDLLPSQKGVLPSGVTSVKGLKGAIQLLFNE